MAGILSARWHRRDSGGLRPQRRIPRRRVRV